MVAPSLRSTEAASAAVDGGARTVDRGGHLRGVGIDGGAQPAVMEAASAAVDGGARAVDRGGHLRGVGIDGGAQPTVMARRPDCG